MKAFLIASAALAGGAGFLVLPTPALAQVNADVGLSGGVMKRFTTGADKGVSDPGFGPVGQLQGHLAVFPMIRVGLYAAYDHSPMPHAGQRNFFTAGLHVKVTPPLLSSPWKLYFFAGFGGGYAEADPYSSAQGSTMGVSTNTTTVHWSKLEGGLLEIPLGVGLATRVFGPFDVFAELGGRFGVGYFGQMYDSQNTAAGTATGLPVQQANFTGVDSFALSLSVGVSLTD